VDTISWNPLRGASRGDGPKGAVLSHPVRIVQAAGVEKRLASSRARPWNSTGATPPLTRAGDTACAVSTRSMGPSAVGPPLVGIAAPHGTLQTRQSARSHVALRNELTIFEAISTPQFLGAHRAQIASSALVAAGAR